MRHQARTLNRITLAVLLAVSMLAGAQGLSASPVGGPKGTVTRVGAYRTDRFRAITFRADEQAIVVVRGDGSTALRLSVFDENGNLIDDDTCRYDRCVASWNPKWTGPFYITVENLGGESNDYAMAVN
jgi:hypothetical protein